jgi:hypothetical protein
VLPHHGSSGLQDLGRFSAQSHGQLVRCDLKSLRKNKNKCFILTASLSARLQARSRNLFLLAVF